MEKILADFFNFFSQAIDKTFKQVYSHNRQETFKQVNQKKIGAVRKTAERKNKMNEKICAMVADRIIAQLDKGVIPWQKPWIASGCASMISHETGKPYSLLNQLLLPSVGEYITFNQCKKEGGNVRKGAHGYPIVFWKQYKREEKDPITEELKIKCIPVLQYYTVFHIDDCENIKPRFSPAEAPKASFDPDKKAEAIAANYMEHNKGLTVNRRGGDRAFYRPMNDYVELPKIEFFSSMAEYYSTMFHEFTHSTGAECRLNRSGIAGSNHSFGSHEYSKEELIAEIGAASLVYTAGLETTSSFENSAAYINGWRNAIAKDNTLVIAAAGKAEKAVEYILDGFTFDDNTPDNDSGVKEETISPIEESKPEENKPFTFASSISDKYPSTSMQSAAAKRIVKETGDKRPAFMGAFTMPDGRKSITNGYCIVIDKNDFIGVPVVDEKIQQISYDSYARLFKLFNNPAVMQSVSRPSLKSLREFIKLEKANMKAAGIKKSMYNPVIYKEFEKENSSFPYVNAELLLDVLTLIPGGDIVIDPNGMGKNGMVYVIDSVNEQAAVILPIRKVNK